jgi:D-alanine-D-alanine ligase-like ATP-grasp enzyme
VEQLGLPFILKPTSTGASLGLYTIHDEMSYQSHLASTMVTFGDVRLAQLIEGVEYTVSG